MIIRADYPGYAPEVYRESRDYRVLLKLIGIVVSVFKTNIDTMPDLYSPKNCPDHLLNLLANMVGYNYNDSIKIEDNRLIIKYFPYMIRRRGSRQGIKLATALTLNTTNSTSSSYSLDNIIIEYDFDTGMIKIYYPGDDELRRDLIEAVRPVGSFIYFVPSDISINVDEIDVKATTKAEVEKYNTDREKVSKSKVNFSSSDLDNQER